MMDSEITEIEPISPRRTAWVIDVSDCVRNQTSRPLENDPELRSVQYHGQARNCDDVLSHMTASDTFQGNYRPSNQDWNIQTVMKKKKRKKRKKNVNLESTAGMLHDGNHSLSVEINHSHEPGCNKNGSQPFKQPNMKSGTQKTHSESEASVRTFIVESHQNPVFLSGDYTIDELNNCETASIWSNGTYTLPLVESNMPVTESQNAGSNHLSKRWSKRQCRQIEDDILEKKECLALVTNQKPLAEFISQHISQRVCNTYIRNSGSLDEDCQCGRTLEWHVDASIRTDRHSNVEGKWISDLHTSLVPCTSFGEIYFQGFGNGTSNSPYVRLEQKTDPDHVWTILTTHWHLPEPTLIITVSGGAKELYLKPRIMQMFKQGLISAATSTGAWIVTGGTATGVMKIVGEAVRDYGITVGPAAEQNRLIALGIATWGIVANRELLDDDSSGHFPAIFHNEDGVSGQYSAILDHNHTHFLLVDNGSEKQYGAEIEFRSSLEQFISSKFETGVAENQKVQVPVVLIVLEGGPNTLKTAYASLQNKTPVVVIKGSQRSADFITKAYKLTRTLNDEDHSTFPDNFDNEMHAAAKYLYDWQRKSKETIDKEAKELVDMVRKMMTENRYLINVFDLEESLNRDLDKALLYALLRANKTSSHSQLSLALAWNRCDIARQEIFTAENRANWQKINMYDAMFTALVQDRIEFVQLFLDYGVDIHRFLTVRTLWNLYANIVAEPPNSCARVLTDMLNHETEHTCYILCKLFSCQKKHEIWTNGNLLRYVGSAIQSLMGEQSLNVYAAPRFELPTSDPTLQWEGNGDTTQEQMTRSARFQSQNSSSKPNDQFDHPFRELFLWAILLNRHKLAKFFWKLGKDHIGGALLARCLLKALSGRANAEEEMDLCQDLLDHAGDFERVAIQVLSECYNKDKRMAHQLLVRKLAMWEGVTLFQLAEIGMAMDFMEHTCCQTKLNIIWKGCMAQYTTMMKIICTMFCPLLILSINFTSNDSPVEEYDGDDVYPNDEAQEEIITVDAKVKSNMKVASVGHSNRSEDAQTSNMHAGTDAPDLFVQSKSRSNPPRREMTVFKVEFNRAKENQISVFHAVYYFYTAPASKFYINVFVYLLFLGLFSYFILTDLHPVKDSVTPSIQEYIIWVWIGTMMVEELRQLVTRDPRSLKYKLKSWYGSVWNRFDVLVYVLFLTSLTLRVTLSEQNFFVARVFYSITLTMFFLRFMQYFYVSRNIGPKVIMISKMLTDLLFFFMILFLFLVSFGVAYHANLYPNSSPSWSVLKGVLHMPYWQMYGELFLETIEGKPVETCTHNASIYSQDGGMARCPESTWIVPILLVIYMILTNILLVNLLIAMFSYTFQKVEENSEKVWRFYRYSLVYEYADRPAIVPPIIILNHLMRLVRYLEIFKCTKQKYPYAFRRQLNSDEDQRMTIFETSAMERYLMSAIKEERERIDTKVSSTAERLENVMTELEDIKEQITVQEQTAREREIIRPREAITSEAMCSTAESDIPDGMLATSTMKPSTLQSDDIAQMKSYIKHLTTKLEEQGEQLSSALQLLHRIVTNQQEAGDVQFIHSNNDCP